MCVLDLENKIIAMIETTHRVFTQFNFTLFSFPFNTLFFTSHHYWASCDSLLTSTEKSTEVTEFILLGHTDAPELQVSLIIDIHPLPPFHPSWSLCGWLIQLSG